MQKKVAGYGRVSTQMQAAEGTSSEEQERKIKDECVKRGWELTKFYCDDGFSGKNSDRPGLISLLNDAKKGNFQTVMVTKLDRLGRSMLDVLNILRDMDEKSLEFYCVDQPEINRNSTSGILLTNILALIAEVESTFIKDRTSEGRIIRWKDGESVIGSLPFGYVKDSNGNTIIDKKKEKIYRRMVSLYVDQHYTLRDIAIKFNSEGVPTPSGKGRWHNVTVNDILKNPMYTGESFQNRFEFDRRKGKSGKQYYSASKRQKPQDQWIKVTAPPMISKERYDRIQRRIESQKRKAKKHHVGYEEHFMAENVLVCGYCGGKIVKRINPINNIYYCCYWWEAYQKELDVSGRKKCQLRYINADDIDNEIFREIADVLAEPSKFANSYFKDPDLEELKAKVENLSDKRTELENRLREGFKQTTNTRDPQIQKIYEAEMKKDEKEFKEISLYLKKAEEEFSFAQNKSSRLSEFEKAFYMKKDRRQKLSACFKTKSAFLNFLHGLPFHEKKRITEAVISPETGGKCVIRYPTPYDFGGDIPIPPGQELVPLMDTGAMIEFFFEADVNKIEAVISSLNKRSLLSKADAG